MRTLLSRTGVFPVLATATALVLNTACATNATSNSIVISSVPDARLYGIGGVISAGFPNGVTVFEGPLSASSVPAGSLSAPLSFGQSNLGIAVDPTDATGAVYVSSSAGQVLKFARPSPNGTTPLFTISGFLSPNYLAFDGRGNLFVADAGPTSVNFNSVGTIIYELKHPITNTSVPLQVINGNTAFVGIALDASNNLYVLAVTPSGSSQLLQAYAPPYTAAPVVTSNGASQAAEIAYDPASNVLFTVSRNAGNTGGAISGYPLPLHANESPTANINITGVMGGLAFDAAGNSFLAFGSRSPTGGSVAVEGPPFTGRASFTFSTSYFMNPITTGP